MSRVVRVIHLHRAVILAPESLRRSEARCPRPLMKPAKLRLYQTRYPKKLGEFASGASRWWNQHAEGRQASAPLPMAAQTFFRPGLLLPLLRLVTCVWVMLWFYARDLAARLARRNTVQLRATRLRKALESLGPIFVKLGQQLSLRADFIPYDYCEELSKLLDRVGPFPTTRAIRIIERSLGKDLIDIFREFDREPMASASLACVYKATLKTGELVAVKVRRHGIGELMAADLRVLDWILTLAELLAILKPGLTENLRAELKLMLLGELNFRKEGRFMDIFRRQARRHKLSVTAPRVFFDWTSPEVLVTELISGISMSQLMHAVDCNDVSFLAKATENRINPRKVAGRLARAVHVGLLESLFFHADPHPANLIILPNNRICFVDFGVCGRFSTKSRHIWRQLHFHMLRRDVSRMVQCALNLVEPLPRINLEEYTKKLESIFADWVYATNSRDAEWWERSTSQNWLKYIGLARQFGVPVNLDTLQVFRATLLYDSVIMRLDKSFDFNKHYRRYALAAGRRARGRVLKLFRRRLRGPAATDYVRFEDIADIAQQSLYRLQRSLDLPVAFAQQTLGKAAYVMGLLLRGGLLIGFIAFAAATVEALGGWLKGTTFSASAYLEGLPQNPMFVAPVLIIGLLLLRKILWRVDQPNSWARNE